MASAAIAENEIEVLRAQIKDLEKLWQHDILQRQAREALLQSELLELKASLSTAKDSEKREVDLLRRRIKTADALLSYLKSKARIMAIPRFAHTSCGIRRQDGVGLVDKRGVPMTQWLKDMKPSSLEFSSLRNLDTALGSQSTEKHSSQDQGDGEYIEHIARAVMQVTDVMEVMLKRAIIAEAEIDAEKEKAKASQDEVKRKTLQLESMWTRVEEMEKVAIGTSGVLKEMQLKLEDMEQETSRQRLRAAENEQELSKVRHDFGVLRSSIDSIISARETVVTLEKRVQEMESISERLSAHVVSLEAGKHKKEAEVAELLVENDRFRAQLDIKEAELVAMKQQVRLLFKQH